MDDERRRAVDAAALGWRRAGHAGMRAFQRQGLAAHQAPLALPAPPAQLALPPPGGSSAAAAASAATPPKKAAAAAPAAASTSAPEAVVEPAAPPRTVGGRGMVHLCESHACLLPAEQFWLASGGAGGDANGGGGSGGKQKGPHRPRGLNRRQ